MKLLPILIIFTAINWHFAWNGTENIPGSVEVWNGNQQIEVISNSMRYNGGWLWWVVQGTELIEFISFNNK